MRTSTISSVIKNLAIFGWIGIGVFVALTVADIDFGVLLASFSLARASDNATEGMQGRLWGSAD